MPEISMFYGIIIYMFAGQKEHNPPHFHAWFGEYEAEFLLNGDILKGSMPKNKQKLIEAWAEIHAEELAADWELCRQGLAPYKIAPLR